MLTFFLYRAMTIERLKDRIINKFGVEIVIFVSGHDDGFRCHYDLSMKVIGETPNKHKREGSEKRLLDPIDIGEDDPIMFESFKETMHQNISRSSTRASVTARALEMSNTHSGYKNAIMAVIPNCKNEILICLLTLV